MKKKLSVALAAAMIAALPASAALADGHEAEVVIVHGVPLSVFESIDPDLTSTAVDILVNGTPAIEGLEYGDDPIVTPLEAGSYELGVAVAGTTDAILELSADLVAGTSVTVAAHLDAEGAPGLNAYVNENDATGIQPFHLAAFGAVDILSGETPVLEGVTNGMTARIDVDGGSTVPDVGIAAAGSTEAAIPLGDVTVDEDTLVLAYAIGPDGELPDVVLATVSVPAEEEPEPENGEEEVDEDADEDAEDEVKQPTHVDSGTGGLLDAGLPVWVAALMIMGALGIAAPAVATARRRS